MKMKKRQVYGDFGPKRYLPVKRQTVNGDFGRGNMDGLFDFVSNAVSSVASSVSNVFTTATGAVVDLAKFTADATSHVAKMSAGLIAPIVKPIVKVFPAVVKPAVKVFPNVIVPALKTPIAVAKPALKTVKEVALPPLKSVVEYSADTTTGLLKTGVVAVASTGAAVVATAVKTGDLTIDIGSSLSKGNFNEATEDTLKLLMTPAGELSVATDKTFTTAKEEVDIVDKANIYTGGVMDMSLDIFSTTKDVQEGEDVDVKKKVIEVAIVAATISSAVATGGTSLAISAGTNMMVDQTGLNPEESNFLVRMAVASAQASGGDVSSAITQAIVDQAKLRGIEVATETVVDNTGIKDDILVSGILQAGMAYGMASGGEGITNDSIDATITGIGQNTAIQITQREALQTSFGNTILGEGVINSAAIWAPDVNITFVEALKSEAVRIGKNIANNWLALNVGHGVTVDNILEEGSRLEVADAYRLLASASLPNNLGLNLSADGINLNNDFSSPDGWSYNPDINSYANSILKEIVRTPTNIANFISSLSVGNPNLSEIDLPDNVHNVLGDIDFDVPSTPDNIFNLGNIYSGKIGSISGIDLGIEKAIDQLGDKAKKIWRDFIEEGYKKYGKQLFEFLLSIFGPKANVNQYDALMNNSIRRKVVYYYPNEEAQYRMNNYGPQEQAASGGLGKLIGVGIVAALGIVIATRE